MYIPKPVKEALSTFLIQDSEYCGCTIIISQTCRIWEYRQHTSRRVGKALWVIYYGSIFTPGVEPALSASLRCI